MKSKTKDNQINEAILILLNDISASQSIENVWNKAELLSKCFQLNILQVYLMICHKLNNIFITCSLIESYCNTTDLVSDKKEIESALELSVLMISQQIAYYENNCFNLNEQPYDPLAFILAFELLAKCLNQFDSSLHGSIIELIHWLEIVRQHYPQDILQSSASERKIDPEIFAKSKLNNRDVNGHSNRRESLSIFDQFGDDRSPKLKVTAKKVNFDF